MNNKTEANILVETFESVRNLSKYYLSNLKGIDVYKKMTVDGKSFNSPYWITAHLVWTEHNLLYLAMCGEKMDIQWLEKFSIGSEPPVEKDFPEYQVILATLDEVHAKAMKLVGSLTNEQLDEPNALNFSFGGVNSRRAVIKHAIRHEPMHIGQISWYLKLNNVEMP